MAAQDSLHSKAPALATLGSVAFALSCSGSPSGPPVELRQALDRVVPAAASGTSVASYDAGPYAVSGTREFDLNSGWDEYCKWLTGQFGSEWRVHAGDDPGGLSLSKNVRGDAYFVSVQRLTPTAPLRVRVTATGLAD
jgi:hypothetical protein